MDEERRFNGLAREIRNPNHIPDRSSECFQATLAPIDRRRSSHFRPALDNSHASRSPSCEDRDPTGSLSPTTPRSVVGGPFLRP
jgi:hypothetical protein